MLMIFFFAINLKLFSGVFLIVHDDICRPDDLNHF